ncbi:hypothetical protein V8E55_007032 [Tylopilus felleus]
MAKPKTLSPQEQYRARKAREEKEKSALLPPGLLNHGNTCFMNSVLQGLIATQYLQLAIHFQPVPLPVPITSRRSPVLTNGHGLSREYDQPWTDALPIGDHLVAVLCTAWDIQNNRKREHMSPKDLLAALGKKYDQYLDFRQQDAHEFLCQLLDAIRMEEMDVIKQRSPPQKKSSKRSHSSRSQHPNSPKPADELSSFVDMLFGGKLASILVCQACKHVSHTYEDFSDLSLSMKPEDYVRERKRDKLKQFAKRIGTALYVGVPQPRSSSVPATPIRDSNLDSPEHNGTQRRRSIDLADVEIVAKPVDDKRDTSDATKDDTALQVPPSPAPDTPSIPGTPTNTPQPVPATDLPPLAPHQDSSGDHIIIVAPEKVNGKERKDKDESWARISRRISVSVGLTRRPKPERKDKKGTTPVTALKPADDESPVHHPASAHVTPDAVNGHALPSPPEREPTSLGLVNEKLQAQLTNVKRSVLPTQRSGNSPSGSSAPRFPLISRPSSPGMPSKAPKRPRAPKLSTEEAAYLRDILADINPPNIPKPFSIFKQTKEPSSAATWNSQNIFLRVNQINRIEECLRLFTSVEVLDGDNTVRCHRCWKIANGFYKPRARGSAQDADSCTDSEDDEPVDAKTNSDRSAPDTSPTNLAIPVASSHPTSPSHSTASLQYTQISRDTQSTLTQPSMRGSSTQKHVPPALQLNDGYPIELVSPISRETPTQGALAVPSIPTTVPGSPMSTQTAKPVPIRTMTQTSTTTEYSLKVSVSAPSDHRQHGFRGGDSNTESEISEAESETLLSVYSDVSSAASSNASPNASQDHLQQPSPTPGTPSRDKPHPSGVPRSRQYLLRPAYKRYLIATPPPILVVHLKRFQQLSKTPVMSFSTGFKKLDDYISFPEFLDLAPYLAPRREDYFDSKVAVTRGRSARRPAPCMYRLYTVVVHIGNMLGGHYVAYTALPPTPPSEADVVRPDHKTRTEQGTSPRDWAFISDTIVRLASLEEVLKSKAYICMYERI